MRSTSSYFLTMAFPSDFLIYYLHFICYYKHTHTYVCIQTTGTCAHIFGNRLNFAIMNGLLRLAMINEILLVILADCFKISCAQKMKSAPCIL